MERMFLVEARTRLGIGLVEAAKRCGITYMAYWLIERKGNDLHPDTALRISNALGVDIMLFYEEKMEMMKRLNPNMRLWLYRIRVCHGLSQNKAAELAGISNRTYIRIESDKTKNVRFLTAKKIAKAFQFDPALFLE